MRKIQKLLNNISKGFFKSVLQNTFGTVIITAIITGFVAAFSKDILWYWKEVLGASLLIFILIKIFTYEKTLKKVSCRNLIEAEWLNIESRMPAIAAKSENGLYIQFMDLPIVLSHEIAKKNYAFEFKAKVFRDCFSWFVNIANENDLPNIKGYMFQYNPNNKTLNPNILLYLDTPTNKTIWLTPETPGTPFKSISQCELIKKDEFYYIRTEVRQYDSYFNDTQ